MWVSEYFRFSKKFKIKHLLYASSSSVYGINREKLDESSLLRTSISVYAAAKSNEMFAHVYINLFNLPTTGLDFLLFMALWKT